jgi:hypothetical protein
LDDKRYGPFKVAKVISPSAYKLQLPPSMKIHPVFNTVKLRPYQEDAIPGRPKPVRPAPVVRGDSPEWVVDYLKDSRLYRGKLQYLVKWKGYPQEESTWEPEENLRNSQQLIKEFHERHPSAARRISSLAFAGLQFKPYENFTEWPKHLKVPDWTQGKHIEGNVP